MEWIVSLSLSALNYFDCHYASAQRNDVAEHVICVHQQCERVCCVTEQQLNEEIGN